MERKKEVQNLIGSSSPCNLSAECSRENFMCIKNILTMLEFEDSNHALVSLYYYIHKVVMASHTINIDDAL